MNKITREFDKKFRQQDFESQFKRARAVTVGTAFGGTTEVNLRANDGSVLWAILQPVEVIELIHQLAASVGCQIHIQPRKDFSSWRNWREHDKEKHYVASNQPPFSNHPPFAEKFLDFENRGAVLPPPEMQPGMKVERNDHEPVATKKTVNRRNTKRAAATT